jgi:uncharacterized protein YxjI
MLEKLFSIGEDFWIQTEGGQRAFKVDGKALRVRETFILEGPSGEELFKIQEKKLHIRDTMKVERDGETVATIKKALITPLRDRFAIELEDGGELSARETLSITSTRSSATARRSRRYPSAGSGSATHTELRLPRERMTR